MNFVEASADLIDGDKDLFLKKAVEFKNIEPDLLYTYSFIWGALLENKDYEALRVSLDEAVERFEIELDVFTGDPDFDPFFESPEGEALIQKYQRK